MIKRVFYNSSLPRSGSTLIQNILGQNPDLYASPSSGMFDLFMQSRESFTYGENFQAQNREETLLGYKSFLKSGINGYYEGITNKPYAIDKCRGWLAEYKFVNEYDPNPKIICVIRDLRSIFSSLEKRYRNNPLLHFSVTDWSDHRGINTMQRIHNLAIAPIMQGQMSGINQMILERYGDKIHFVKFEELCKFPNETMEELYNYLELPYYQHDFDNIEQITFEHDAFRNPYAHHIIQNKLTTIKEDYIEILGEEASNYIVNNYKWFYKYFNYKI